MLTALDLSLRTVLAERGIVVENVDEPLELDSLTLVEVIEHLEDHTGARIRAAEVLPEHFDTFARILAFAAKLIATEP